MRSTKAGWRRSFAPVLGVFACTAGFSAVARAQAVSPGGDKVAAEALFEDGRHLVGAGKYADACPKFVESERLDPSPSTLLNLANCWEKLGRTASAWATYREAESAASAARRQEYVDTAERHARTLAPTLARLTVIVEKPTDGIQVKRDGVAVGSAEWGSAIPVDAGSHSVEASAPGHKRWSTNVDVPHDGAQVTASVPPLEELPVEGPPPPPPAPASATPGPAPLPAAPPPKGGTQRTIGLVVAGAGVVGLGVSGVLALIANGKNADSKNGCIDNVCVNTTAFDDRNQARSMGDAATVAFVAGAAALVAGGVLWFAAPRETEPGRVASARIAVLPTVGGAMIEGSW
jgi:hypothetical protein